MLHDKLEITFFVILPPPPSIVVDAWGQFGKYRGHVQNICMRLV